MKGFEKPVSINKIKELIDDIKTTRQNIGLD